MARKKEPKNKQQQRVGRMLDRAASSPVAVCARYFREAGFAEEPVLRTSATPARALAALRQALQPERWVAAVGR